MDRYSLSGEEAYTVLTGEILISMESANRLLELASSFEEVRVPLPKSDGKVLSVSLRGGYYNVQVH